MDNLRLEDPYIIINHAYRNNLTEEPGFEWIPEYLATDSEIEEYLRAFRTIKQEKKYKFGVEVPRNPRHALELDNANGTTGWKDSIKTELDQIMDYEVFVVIPDGEPVPDGYKRIPYHIVHDVKFDGRLKSRLVAGGHRSPEVPKEDTYSSVVSMEAMRIGFLLAKLNNLQVCAGDVGNAFLYGKTKEKVLSLLDQNLDPS